MAEVIAAVLGWDPVEALGTLGEIIQRRHHLVVPVDVERLSRCRRSIYRFRHTLFASWLYAQLSPAERGCLHERIGITLEQPYPDRAGQLAAQLACHFEAAGLTEKAIECYRQAARHAARVAADREALDLLRSGLGLITRLPAGDDRERCELDLQLEIGLTLIALHGYAASEVSDCLARVRELHRRTGEQKPLFMMLWQYTMFAGLRADCGRAIDAAEEMMALANRSEDPNAAAVAFLARGWLVLMVGRIGDARADLDRVTLLAGTPRDLAAAYGTEPVAAALARKSWGHWLRGDPAAARDCRAQAIARARESGHPLTLAFALGVAGASLHNFLEESEVRMQHALLLAKAGASRQARAEMRRAIQTAQLQGSVLLRRRATSTLSELDASISRRARGGRNAAHQRRRQGSIRRDLPA